MDHTISKTIKIDEDKDIYLEKQKEEQTKITYERASIFDLYKYAEVKFIILLIVGTINSIVWGILFPLKFLVTREIFQERSTAQKARKYSGKFVCLT